MSASAAPAERSPLPLHDPEAEAERLRGILASDPNDVDARAALAALLETQGDRAGADALLAELDAPGDDSATLRRIAVLVRAGRAVEARTALESLSESARATTSARMSAARLALAEDRPEDAVRELAPIAELPDAEAAVLALYARALLATGRVAAASNAYAASVERDAALPEALLGRADMAVRSRRPDAALRTLARLDRALVESPRPPSFHARLLFLRGRAQLMSGQTADARRTLRRVAASAGAPSEAHFFLGEALSGHDSRGARAAYTRYLELEPEGHFATRARRALGRED